MSNHYKTIQSYLPWIQSPLIVNGPMGGFAGSALATAVTKAGGHGQIGSVNDPTILEQQLVEVQRNLSDSPDYHHNSTLPVGVGFLVFIGNLEKLLPLVKKYRPAVLWMFAAVSLDDYAKWAKEFRSVSPDSKIWIQVGPIESALEIAANTKPDALVIQGSDAGGHGYEKSAGIISLLPEALDALASNGFGHIPVLASGGIVDGRGVAAALSLGASGVVMGTRFLGASETVVHPDYRRKILDTKYGGQHTIRSKVFDELQGPNKWPKEYDGRAFIAASYRDHAAGVDVEELRKKHAEVVRKEHRGFGEGDEDRAAVWMGAGVGLVNKLQSAKEIVEEVREAARKALVSASAFAKL